MPPAKESGCFQSRHSRRSSGIRTKGQLAFHGQLEALQCPKAFAACLEPLYSKSWVVYVKRPFGGPEQVLEYLGRYTHRVGISNARILEVTDEQVAFSYRDRKHDAGKKTMRLHGVEFLRRFFLHVLPKRFTRIRNYGFLGNAVRKANIPLIRELIGQPMPDPVDETPIERIARVYDIDLNACPNCRTGRMENVGKLVRVRCKDPPRR